MDLAVLRPGVVVFGLENHLAVTVADAQLVVAVPVGILGVDVGVEVADGPHIVDAVAVGRNHIRENQVVLNDNGVADGVAAAGFGGQRQRHRVVAPGGVGVGGARLACGLISVAEVPYKAAGVVGNIVGKEGGEAYLAVGLAHQAGFRSGEEVNGGLRRGDDVVPFRNGILTTLCGGDNQFHGIGAGVCEVEGRLVIVSVFHHIIVFVEHNPKTGDGVGGGGGEVGELADNGRAAGGHVRLEVGLRQRVEVDIHGVGTPAVGVRVGVEHLHFENVFAGGDNVDVGGVFSSVPHQGGGAVAVVGVEGDDVAGAVPLVGTEVGLEGVDDIDIDAVGGPDACARDGFVDEKVVPAGIAGFRTFDDIGSP